MSKVPLDPSTGTAQAPPTNATKPDSHQQPSVGHDLNSAHRKKDDIESSSRPGMATNKTSKDETTPNWMAQDDILDAASKGQATGKTVERDVDQVKRDQHPDVEEKPGEQRGPTGMPIGRREGADPGVTDHDRKQAQLKAGLPSNDGEGSAGLPFDAGK